MSSTQSRLVESLCAPCPGGKFLGEYWPDKPFSTHGDPARLPAYLRCEALSSFANLSARYHGTISFGNAAATNSTAVANDVPAALLRKMGLSLYLPDLGDYVPGTNEFLRELEQELGACPGAARIGAFAAAVHNGVTSHFDAEEVISVQLEGKKRFYIAPLREIRYPYGMQYGPGYEAFDDLYPQMDAGIPKVSEEDFECIEMRPGSMLFMPRGTWHRTEATQESLSVSIIIRQPAAFEDVLAQLRLLLLRDPKWRRPLYAGGRPGAAALARVPALLDDLPRAAQALTQEDILAAAQPDPLNQPRHDEGRWLQRVPNAGLLLTPHPQRDDLWTGVVRISRHDASDRDTVQLQLPAAMLSIFQWLAQEERPLCADMATSRFPAIAQAQVKTIFDTLVRAGYLKLLRHAPLSPLD